MWEVNYRIFDEMKPVKWVDHYFYYWYQFLNQSHVIDLTFLHTHDHAM